jgi:hypothetical protein
MASAQGGRTVAPGFSIFFKSYNACPEVVIEADGVRIGEPGNMVRLSHAEWNQLVALVRSGKLPATEQR